MRNRVETAWIMAEIEPYSFTCKPSVFLLLMRKYCRDSVFVQLAFTFAAGPEIEVAATFETLLLKVLRTDMALAKFGHS